MSSWASAVKGAGLEGGDHSGQGSVVAGQGGLHLGFGRRRQDPVALGDHGVDHGGQSHGLTVLGREDPGHAITVQVIDLVGHDGPATPAVDAHIAPTGGAEAVDQVAEVLDVAPLIGADRHPLNVLLDGRGHHLVDGAVVAQVHHLGALRL